MNELLYVLDGPFSLWIHKQGRFNRRFWSSCLRHLMETDMENGWSLHRISYSLHPVIFIQNIPDTPDDPEESGIGSALPGSAQKNAFLNHVPDLVDCHSWNLTADLVGFSKTVGHILFPEYPVGSWSKFLILRDSLFKSIPYPFHSHSYFIHDSVMRKLSFMLSTMRTYSARDSKGQLVDGTQGRAETSNMPNTARGSEDSNSL